MVLDNLTDRFRNKRLKFAKSAAVRRNKKDMMLAKREIKKQEFEAKLEKIRDPKLNMSEMAALKERKRRRAATKKKIYSGVYSFCDFVAGPNKKTRRRKKRMNKTKKCVRRKRRR